MDSTCPSTAKPLTIRVRDPTFVRDMRETHMKLITAIVKPYKLDDVKEALKASRRRRHHRHRSERIRPSRWTHRDLSRCRIQNRLPSQGEARILADAPDVDRIVDVDSCSGQYGQDR